MTTDAIEQRRFSGTVWADQAENLTRLHGEIHIAQYGNASKVEADTLQR